MGRFVFECGLPLGNSFTLWGQCIKQVEHLFERPCILTAESAGHLDPQKLNYEQHDGLVLDNMNSRVRTCSGGLSCKLGMPSPRVGEVHRALSLAYNICALSPDVYQVDPEAAYRSNWLCEKLVLVKLPRG